MNGAIATLIAVIASIAAVITAIGGVLLAIRTVRNRERQALTRERNTLETMLQTERQERVELELRNYEMQVLLARNGIEVPAGVRPKQEIVENGEAETPPPPPEGGNETH